MKRLVPICLLAYGFGCILVGCNAGTVSEAQQEEKAKAMNDIAKEDPNYAAKQAAHGGGGRN